MKKIILRHAYLWRQKEFLYSVFFGIILFTASMVINHFANIYTNKNAGQYVNDILLDNLPVLDVDGILNYGSILFTILIVSYLAIKPIKTSFTLKSLALFIIIRSVFITLTHLGPAPIRTPIDPSALFADAMSGNDFFFSGHAGIPFLMALIFWKNKFVRYISIAISIIFGASVILGHLHYSIDVFSAFFITYGIFHIAQKLFAKDYKSCQCDKEFEVK